MNKKLTALVIMDGYGLCDKLEGNAIKADGSKNVCRLIHEYPSSKLKASGMAVGLPEGQMGNSEVGHLNMGAGRVVYQELTRITKSIDDGDFFTNSAFKNAVNNCKKHNSQLHLMGLVSDGGVHSHITHISALIELAKREGIDKVYLHCFLDGRDVSPTSGLGFVEQMQQVMAEKGVGKIATVCGRMYAMDRDNRWERVEKAYDMLALGKGEEFAHNGGRAADTAQCPEVAARGVGELGWFQRLKGAEGQGADNELEAQVEHKACWSHGTWTGKAETGKAQVVNAATPYEWFELVMADNAQHCACNEQTDTEEQHDGGEYGHRFPPEIVMTQYIFWFS